MPFGLDLKSMIVAAVLVLFVWPWIQGMFLAPRTPADRSA